MNKFGCVILLAFVALGISGKKQTDVIQMLLGSYGSADRERIQLYEFNQSTGEACKVCGLKGVAEVSYLKKRNNYARI